MDSTKTGAAATTDPRDVRRAMNRVAAVFAAVVALIAIYAVCVQVAADRPDAADYGYAVR